MALCAAAAAAALVAAAAAQSAPTRRLESPRLSEIGRAAAPIPDAALPSRSVGLLAPGTYWGGTYRTSTGESVTVYASNAYPTDPAMGQRWADFLATLVHGSELSTINVFLAPLSEVTRICGQDALACYSAAESALVAPGEDPSADFSAEAVVTHEYGHHVAASRSDAPWAAINYGTKRWASYMQVCAKTRAGQLFPGAEDRVRYVLNPGEGFAESYRVLNERKAGLAEPPWQVVSDSLYPDASALTAVEEDVMSPWRGATASFRRGTFTRTARVRTYTVPTQLDGTLKVTLRLSAGVRLAVDVTSSTTRLVHAAGATAFSRTATICGQRSLRIRVSAVRGTGSFQLTLSKP